MTPTPPVIQPRLRTPFLRRTSASVAVALVLAALAVPSSAALYKWTDATGRAVYSDQAPPGNIKYDVIGGAPPPANPNAVKELAGKEADFKKRQQDQMDAAGKLEKANADATRLRNYCLQLRNQIVGLGQPNVLMYRINEKGERVLMNDAERKMDAEKLERTLRENNCPA